MATFRYGSGAVTASKMVIVKDAVVNATNTAFTVDQPANTCLTGVFVKVTGAVDLDSNGTIGLGIGDAVTETDIFTDADLFLGSGGQEIPVGTVYNVAASRPVNKLDIKINSEAKDVTRNVSTSSQ